MHMRVCDIEPKRITAFDGLERGDVKDLGRIKRFIFGDRPQIGVVAQIRMPLTKGVTHLGDHTAQHARLIVAEPERNRVKHMAEQPWLRQQINASVQIDLMRLQNIPHPRGTTAGLGYAAMVAIMQRHQVARVPRKKPRCFKIGISIDQHIINAVTKRIFHRPAPAMVGFARDMIDGAHSAATWTRSNALSAVTTS